MMGKLRKMQGKKERKQSCPARRIGRLGRVCRFPRTAQDLRRSIVRWPCGRAALAGKIVAAPKVLVFRGMPHSKITVHVRIDEYPLPALLDIVREEVQG
jgi:hypothetical protein